MKVLVESQRLSKETRFLNPGDRLFAPRKETGSETGFLKETRFLG